MISERQNKDTTYIVFGGIPSLLHIHNIHVKDRAELHLDRPVRICTEKYYREYKRRCSPMKTTLSIKNQEGAAL